MKIGKERKEKKMKIKDKERQKQDCKTETEEMYTRLDCGQKHPFPNTSLL